MTVHQSDNMASWLPKTLSEAQTSELNKKAIPINKKKVIKLGLVVFQVRFYFKHHATSQFHKRSRNRNANTKQLSTSEFVYKFQNMA